MEKLKKATTDTTIKDIRDLFRLQKENKAIKQRILRGIRNIFRLQKKNKAITDIILRNNRNLFENEEENYYTPIRVSNFWIKNYIEYKSNSTEIK